MTPLNCIKTFSIELKFVKKNFFENGRKKVSEFYYKSFFELWSKKTLAQSKSNFQRQLFQPYTTNSDLPAVLRLSYVFLKAAVPWI